MAVIIEVLGWGGKSQRHYRAEGPSITIGRGYQNDVVLGDSHISANHLRLDAVEGGWQLNDLQSLNGVEVIKNPFADSTASTMVLADGAEIKIGRTKLRIIADSHPVEAAKELHRLEKDVGQLNRFSIWLPLFLLVLVIDIGTLYANSFVEWQWKNSLSSILVTQLFLLVLALFWAGVGRFLREEGNFLGHYNLILLATLVYSLSGWFVGVIGYNLSAEIFNRDSVAAVYSAIGGAIAVGQFCPGNHHDSAPALDYLCRLCGVDSGCQYRQPDAAVGRVFSLPGIFLCAGTTGTADWRG